MATPVILLTGFEPFGGETTNPSWDVASRLQKASIEGASITALRLPVDCKRAAQQLTATITRLHPAAVIGLGQAGGRPALSIEKIAINLADERAENEAGERAEGRPIIRGGPDAYFARLPIPAIVSAITRNGIPAAMSLSAGAYVCNTVMYTALHVLRRRPETPAGFIHLPYEAGQAVRHRASASMSADLMVAGVRAALSEIVRTVERSDRLKVRRRSSSASRNHRPPPSSVVRADIR
ncbi:MAG: pyroglutamyl-peptidase I [Candidatus Binataceae bacterium]|jgi:pyroglutamyl-peptidase